MSYNALKVVHLTGVVLFLGNIIVTAVWKILADRTGEPRVIAYAQRLVTAGGAALIVVGAYGMVASICARPGSSGDRRCSICPV